MIIVKLWGGMCNQMFQYAFGYAIAKRYNDDLAFDVDFYENQPGHVGKRKVIGKEVFPNLSKMQFIKRPSWVKPFENKYINHIIRYHGGCHFPFLSKNMVVENYHKYYSTVPFSNKKLNFYDGYWQTDKYFEDFREELCHEFSPTEEIANKVEQWKKSTGSHKCVAVHIRRGDYLNSINQKSLGEANVIGNMQYYKKAMELMIEKLESPTFCFFSDDINWCKENFASLYNRIIFAENSGSNAALLDLLSISACEHGIMSPSTFSWWGNWLRKNTEESIVICPRGDVGNEYFVCRNWIEI